MTYQHIHLYLIREEGESVFYNRNSNPGLAAHKMELDDVTENEKVERQLVSTYGIGCLHWPTYLSSIIHFASNLQNGLVLFLLFGYLCNARYFIVHILQSNHPPICNVKLTRMLPQGTQIQDHSNFLQNFSFKGGGE